MLDNAYGGLHSAIGSLLEDSCCGQVLMYRIPQTPRHF
jgi:hypothetical protein